MYGVSPYGSLPIGAGPPFVAPPAATNELPLFLSSRRFDAATLTASSAEDSLPVTFLQDPDPAAVWRALGTNESVIIDLGGAFLCDSLIIAGHDLTADGNLRARTAIVLADLTANPLSDTGGRSPWPSSGKPLEEDWPVYLSLLRWPPSICRFIRLDIADPGNPAGFVQAARIYAGRGLRPRYSLDANIGLGLDSPDEQVRSAFGKTFLDPRGDASRRLTLPMSAVNDADLKREMFELQRYAGLGRDFGFVMNPGATTDFHLLAMQSVFANGAQFERQPMFDSDEGVWRTSLTLIEML